MKRLAGGIVRHSDTLGWHLILYSIVDGKLAPFAINPFPSRDEALSDATDTLKITETDWVEIEDDEAEQIILDNAQNRWSPAEYAKRRGLGGGASAP